jgi:hypothetical protein
VGAKMISWVETHGHLVMTFVLHFNVENLETLSTAFVATM